VFEPCTSVVLVNRYTGKDWDSPKSNGPSATWASCRRSASGAPTARRRQRRHGPIARPCKKRNRSHTQTHYGPAAVVGAGVRCIVGVHSSSSSHTKYNTPHDTTRTTPCYTKTKSVKRRFIVLMCSARGWTHTERVRSKRSADSAASAAEAQSNRQTLLTGNDRNE